MTASVKHEPGSGGNETKNCTEAPAQVTTSKRTKSYESRKIRKPLMEKRRRARINESLNELKRILLEANGTPTKKEGNRPAKLEKADILELTVKHLQSIHPISSTASTNNSINNLSQSINNSNKSSSSLTSPTTTTTTSGINVSSTCSIISDTDDDTSSSCSNSQSIPMQITNTANDIGVITSAAEMSCITGLKHESNSTKGHNNEIETPYIHGIAECIRLIQTSMKSSTSTNDLRALEDKLKNHLAELHQVSVNKSPELRHHEYKYSSRSSPLLTMIDDHEEHELLKLKGPDSPASFHSQMSPILISNSYKSKGNHFTSGNNHMIGISSCSNSPNSIMTEHSNIINMSMGKASSALLIPTRMSNGDIAYVLRCSDNRDMSYRGGGCGNSLHGGGGGYFDVNMDNHHSYYGRKGEKHFSGFTDNPLDIDNHRGVWRPW